MNIFSKWIDPINYSKIGFEDVKFAIKHPDSHILINTLSLDLQKNIIKGTIPAEKEELIINKIIEDYEMSTIKILIYGRNATDNSAEKKAKQIIGLGFANVFLYCGGMFEWLLLQEIYGYPEFPTTIHSKNIDLLIYRPAPEFGSLRLTI
jgi:hypothetical protein